MADDGSTGVDKRGGLEILAAAAGTVVVGGAVDANGFGSSSVSFPASPAMRFSGVPGLLPPLLPPPASSLSDCCPPSGSDFIAL